MPYACSDTVGISDRSSSLILLNLRKTHLIAALTSGYDLTMRYMPMEPSAHA